MSLSPLPSDKEHKYARREYERRFLLAGMPPGTSIRTVVITDRYLAGTRLRLRRAVTPGDVKAELKLTQKVPAGDGGPGLITTFSLSKEEYGALSVLPARLLRKVRRSFPPFGVDEFEGPLAGLCLAEAEFGSAEEYRRFTPPDFVVAEVTGDPDLAGGTLVGASRATVAQALAKYGVRLPD